MNAENSLGLIRKIPVRPPFHRFTWSWILLLGILTAGMFWVMLTTAPPVAQIPYSKFIEQVRAGNVEQVQVTDGEIVGSFILPVLWASASNTSNASANAIYPASAYSNFRVIRGRSLGGSSLEEFLTEFGVTRAVSVPTPWGITLLRYTLPFALLIVTGIWILRQFPFKPQPLPLRMRGH